MKLLKRRKLNDGPFWAQISDDYEITITDQYGRSVSSDFVIVVINKRGKTVFKGDSFALYRWQRSYGVIPIVIRYLNTNGETDMRKAKLYLTPEPVLTDVKTGLPDFPEDYQTLGDIPDVINHDGYTGITFVTDSQDYEPLRDTFGDIIDNYNYALVLTSNGAIIGAWFTCGYRVRSRCDWIANPYA